MTDAIFESHVNKFKEELIDRVIKSPDEFLYGNPSIFMKGENPKTKEIGTGLVEGLDTVFDGGFIYLPQVLDKIFQEVPPLAIALISHISLPEEAVINTEDDHTHSEALFVQLETHNKECTICWEVIDDGGVTSLNNIFNPEYGWRVKQEKNEHLISKLYVYIEPEL